TINFAPGVTGILRLNLDIGKYFGPGKTMAAMAVLPISKSLTINGPGPKSNDLTISGSKHTNIFTIAQNVTVSISNLTIADGISGGGPAGAAISNAGIFSGTNLTFQNHENQMGGSVIENEGTMTITNSTIYGTTSQFGDGVTIVNHGIMQITSSTIQ